MVQDKKVTPERRKVGKRSIFCRCGNRFDKIKQASEKRGGIMELKDYCKNVEIELTAWKAKLYDVTRKIEKLPTGDKQRMFDHINGLNLVVSELDDRIDQLRTECPTEWNPTKEEIKVKIADLDKRFNDASDIMLDYDFGG